MPFYSAYITYSSSLIFIYKVIDFSIFLPWKCEKNLKYPIYQLWAAQIFTSDETYPRYILL